MAGIIMKLLVPCIVTVAAGTALALSMTSAPIATDLTSRSAASLGGGDFGWAAIRIDGRDAIVSGTATTQAMIDDVIARVAAVPGIRAVSSDVVLAEFVSPFPFAATIDAGTVTLSGGYPNETVHAAILTAAGEASDQTRLLSGGPDAAAFQAAATYGLEALKHFDQGRIELADLSLSITGRARTTEAYGVLQGLTTTVPAGVELAALQISAPIASPYTWTARFDGLTLTLSGHVPDERLEARLRALPASNIAVSTSLVLASGEPEGFDAKALELLEALLLLERGEVSIVDGTVTLSGAPESTVVADQVTAAVTAAGGTATLEPPRIADFALAIDKSGSALAFTGFVPDAEVRDKLAALGGADVSGVELGRGAPDRFQSGLDFGLDMLSHFRDGRFELRGTRLSLGGRAASVGDFNTVLGKAGEGAPQGFTLVLGDVRPPVASPFTFTAVRDAGGRTAVSGYVPDEASRAELRTRIADLATDTADPADGAPDNFTFYAGKGLEVLALLDTGTLSFDGANWSIEGVVDTPQKGFAADAAYSVAGLRTLGWTYTVRLPEAQVAAALPIISPYAWRAQKGADGSVSFTGFAPSQAFKSYLKVRAGDALDGTALGAGAPDDFGMSAVAGLDALLALDEGSLGLNGARWTLTGEVADAASREAIQSALAARVNASNWQIAIQARDSAPVVTPYLWSATKGNNGVVDLAGYLPNAALQAFSAVRAINVGRDTTAIASGEPAGFADDLLAALDALTHITDGKAAFDGSRWVLTGTVASQEQGEAAIAALARGSRNGSLWTSALAGYAPPAPVAEPSSEAQPTAEASPEPSPEPSSEPSSEAPVSSEPAPEPSSEPVSAEPSSVEPPSIQPLSAEPPSTDPASSEPVAPEPESSEPPASSETPADLSSSTEAEVEDERSLIVVDPLPARFVFEASKESRLPVTLMGGVPAEATAAYFGVIAGNVATDAMRPQPNLPDDFIASGTAGLNALVQVNEGRLGFDGLRWWLRGMVEDPALRDALSSEIAALPNGADWSVFIGVLGPLEICRDRVAELERRNAITFQSGSATLTESSLPVLDELAVDLNICPEASVHVEGHTDSDGAEDLNLALSVARAETVVEALIARNVDLERLYAEGYGESKPIADNETRDGKAANRRIAFSISEE
jgi:outer membrane protein OmpA-like peptidoglycan-associated protein